MTDYVYVCVQLIQHVILFRHRTEGSREIALRLRELSVLPPSKANRSQDKIRFLKSVVVVCKAIIC